MGFSKEFVWGAAMAAYQIEGAAQEGGKGMNVWDAFCRRPGKVFGGQTGDVACDHYHRFEEDFKLMAALGIRNYRFSVNWSRVLPDGTGRPNEEGLAFYDRLIDSMLENGIRPWMTLFHWEYPVALQAMGAWENPDSPRWFSDYATLVARRYGDRVKDFFTLNEPQCFIGLGCVEGNHAPGLKLPIDTTIPMSHRVLTGHGLAVQALRADAPGAKVGYVPCSSPAYPLTESPEDVEAARTAYFSMPEDPERWFWNVSWWSDPAILGGYPEDGLRLYEKYLPKGYEKDLPVIRQKLDYYAQNIYNGYLVRASAAGPERVPMPEGIAKTGMGWPVTPECLYWGPKFLCERYKLPLIIAENGMSDLDGVSLDGCVHDAARINFLHRYLRALKRLAGEGTPVAGYFHWSFLDNFEWANGFNDRFGLVYVDYATQERLPKDSAAWYKAVMETNGENL